MRAVCGLVICLAVSGPAVALDCGKAASPIEAAICADPATRAADAAMAQAFAALMAAESPAAKPTITAAQRRWLRDRDAACADEKAVAACVTEQSARRRAFLAAEAEAGPGAPGRLAPVFRIEPAAKGRAAINLQLLKFPAPATPAERAFDAAVDKLVGPLDEPDAGDPAADRYAYERTMRLVFASPALMSAQVEGFSDTGGAHPLGFDGNVNIDVAGDREAEFADLVDAKGAKAVFALCLRQVGAAKKARLGAEAPASPADARELAKAVAAATGDLRAWSFGPDQATVTYDPYAVGAYAEGGYTCDVPYPTLKPFAKAGFPLP